MASQGVFQARSAPRPSEGGGDWALRSKYALSDVPTLLWRERQRGGGEQGQKGARSEHTPKVKENG